MTIVTRFASTWNGILWASMWLVCGALTAPPTLAQAPAESPTQTAAPANGAPTVEKITQLQTSAAGNAELTEEQKTRVTELAQQAIADIQAADALKADAARFASTAENVPQKLKEVQQKLRELEREDEPGVDPQSTATELETQRNDEQQTIAELEKELTQPSLDPTARMNRRRAARQFLIEAPAKLQQSRDALAASPPDGEPPVLTSLRQARIQAELQVLEQRATAAQNELLLLDAEDAVDLPTLKRDLVNRQLARLRKQVELETNEINRLRQQEAESRFREAREAAMQAHPRLKSILEANKEIALEEAEIRKSQQTIEQRDKELEQQLADLQKDFQNIENLDREFGLSASIGLRLRKLRTQLPSVRAHQTQLDERLEASEEAQFTLYQRRDELDNLNDIEARANEIVAESASASESERAQLNEDALTALRTQKDYLEKVVDAYRKYTEALTRLDLHEQELIEQTNRFAEFIDERVLWVRSHGPMSVSDVMADRESISWLADSSTWRSLGQAIAEDLSNVPLLYAAVAALLVFLLMLQRRMGRRLREVTKHAQSRVSVSLMPTVRAIEYTLLAAIIWPALLLFLAWRFRESPEPRIVLAMSTTLIRLSGILLMMELIRQSMRPHGLCEVHFGLHGATARRIRQRIRQLMILGIPLAAAIALIHFYNGDGFSGDSRSAFLERLLFIAAMLVIAYVAHGLLRRDKGDLRELGPFQDGGWSRQFRLFWYLFSLGLPLILAGLAAAGYYYSAQKLAIRCQVTVGVLLALMYVRAFLLRWLMLRHRRLRLQQLRERQQALQKDLAKEDIPDEAGSPLPEVAADETDLDSISRQSQRLVSTTFVVFGLIGVWVIWSDVVPALRFLDRWPLWDYVVQVREETPGPDGAIEYTTKEVVKPVTIAHVALVVLIVVLTITAARNVPGLLEITLLERLPIDRSTTYAVTALVRYTLVLMGIVLASRTLGIGWSKVQWLAAALTFGLGFGLQEIFANFVSGLIILFEQPVRVGDVVTIDGVSGVVNRIRIRATTITDWDRKEYIVPNREFITGRLLNWTLSDKMNRLVINVGVAYGSDTELARKTILSVAEEHENVLEDPAPLVTFEAFGDSALSFVLRAYLPSLDARLQTIHDLHVRIDQRLRAAGIEIPFPQRDLHLRTSVVLADNGHHAPNGRYNPVPQEAEEVHAE